jgi:CheY-like chemotaxis protein
LTVVVGYEQIHAKIVRHNRTQHWEVTASMTVPETHSTPQQRSRKHIYVVNGSPDFLDVVRALLQDEHYNVTTTNFVPESFATIQVAQPAMLIIDLVLGEMAGWDLLRRLHEAASTNAIPILLVSTSSKLLEEAREQHDAFGGDRYLVKPFDLEDLLTAVGETIGTA